MTPELHDGDLLDEEVEVIVSTRSDSSS